MVQGRQDSPTVVVDLGRGSIRLAVAESHFDAVRFHDITEIKIPHGDADRPEDSNALAAQLLRNEVDRHGWSGMSAACILSGSATSTQSIMLPPMPEADRRRAIELKLKDTLHFDFSEATYDFTRTNRTPISADSAVSGEPTHTLVAVAQTKVIDSSLDLVRSAGLIPVAVSTAAESLANLSQCTSLWDGEEASIYIDIGSRSSILNLFEGKELRLSREIDIAGDAFTKALMEPMLAADKTVQLSFAQAEALKSHAGYPLVPTGDEVMHGIKAREMHAAMEPIAQRFAAEVERSIGYLCNLLGRERVDGIVLSGSGGRMPHFDRFLREALSTPVVYSDPVERAMVHWRLAVTGARPDELAGFSAILGYSLGEQASINLLPEEAIREQAYAKVTRMRRIVAPLVAATGVCLAMAGTPITRAYADAAQQLSWSSENVDKQLSRQEGVSVERDAIGRRLAAIGTERGELPDWTGFLKELSMVLPDGCWVTALETVRTSSGHSVLLRASVLTAPTPFNEMNALITRALAGSPFLRDVHVVQATSAGSGSTGTYEASFFIVAPSTAQTTTPGGSGS